MRKRLDGPAFEAYVKQSSFGETEYQNLLIQIGGPDYAGRFRPLVKVEAQRHREAGEQWSRWYGVRIQTLDLEDAKSIEAAIKIMRRLLKLFGGVVPRTVDADFVKTIQRMGKQVVYDPRIHEHVPLDKVAPADYRLFGAFNEDGIMVMNVLAADYLDARKQLEKAVTEAFLQGGLFRERYLAWLSRQEVREIVGGPAPDARPLAELVEVVQEPVAAV